jgi:ABC-2 type transport system ATP-binding protein
VVRSPQLDVLRSALGQYGATVRDEGDSLVVSAMDIAKIGELAAERNVVLHELSPQRGSLEEAFIQLTGDSVEYHAEVANGQVPATDLTAAGK